MKQGWSFRKEVSLGELVALVVFLCGLAIGYAALTSRIAVAENNIQTSQVERSVERREIIERLVRIENILLGR